MIKFPSCTIYPLFLKKKKEFGIIIKFFFYASKMGTKKVMKKKVFISLFLLRDVVQCKLYYEGDSHALHNKSSKTDLIYNSNPIRFYER